MSSNVIVCVIKGGCMFDRSFYVAKPVCRKFFNNINKELELTNK